MIPPLPEHQEEKRRSMEFTGTTSTEELREKTDRSLEEERDKTDEYLTHPFQTVEEKTREKVHSIRHAADQAKESQREALDDDKAHFRASADTLLSQIDDELLSEERERFDELQAAERQAVDRIRAEEGAQKQLLVGALLEHERQQTDSHLLDERIHEDSELITREHFLSIVSHDLKNLLAAIGISARLMRKSLSKGETGSLLEHLGRIQHSADAMGRMISDLLDVERMAQGKLTLHLARVDLRSLLRECRELFTPLASNQGLSMRIEAGVEPLFVDIDHDRILQVLSNLIGNSLKFTPRGGAIDLSVRKRETFVEVSVTDNGPGISAEEQARIFERFSQLNVADRQGLGLGLFIAKWIVEAHEGGIWVTSIPGNGSSFSFTLPLSSV
ncbi:MAG: ATP-binding protein [Nitrospira sp.]|nr:ATP-binding protein [Nitrospira sp.]